jgi:PAS domain-containing protein
LRATEPLALHHSWALTEKDQRFDLGLAVRGDVFERACSPVDSIDRQAVMLHGAGRWSCSLKDNALSWTSQIYALFGLPSDVPTIRQETVRLYDESSRAAMERLRAYAIRHKRGFLLDAKINAADGQVRWMRLIAAPVCEGPRVIRLHGLKFDVSATYA